jgi:hypothetical protein
MQRLAIQDVLNFIYPDELRLTEDSVDKNYERLRDHLSEIGNVIEIMENRIILSCRPEERTNKLKEFHKRLLQVADILVKDGNPLLGEAAIDIAALVVCKGGDTVAAKCVYDEFEKRLRDDLENFEGVDQIETQDGETVTIELAPIHNESDVYEHWIEFYTESAALVFAVTSRIPLDIKGADSFHQYAIDVLTGMAVVDIEAYQCALLEHFDTSLKSPESFPSTLKIMKQSFEYISLVSLPELEKMIESENPKEHRVAWIRTIDIIKLSALLTIYCQNLPDIQVKSCFCWKSGGGKRVLGWLKFAWQNQRLVEGEALRAA